MKRIADRGGDDVILERIAVGETISQIARDYETSRPQMQMWLTRGERRIRYQAARLRAPPLTQRLGTARHSFYLEITRYGGEEKIFEAIASGKTLNKIAQELTCARPTLDKWLRYGKRAAKYEAAKLASAGALADEAKDLVDDVDISDPSIANAAISKAREQANQRKWRASILDNAQYGNKENTGGNISIGALHLNALIKYGGPQALPKPVLEGDVVEIDQIESGL